MMTSFTYEPLFGRQIRLLQVTQVVDEQVHLQLRTFSIAQEMTSFQALSYTWGKAAILRKLMVNDCAFSVSDNLFEFLKIWGQQLMDEEVLLWIDQICIDQDNVAEKSWQVPLMAEIYSIATRTITWLGTASSSVSTFVRYLQDVKGVREIDLGPTPVDYKIWPEDCIQGIEDIYTAPYWTRVWIVQEVIVARKVVVYCGLHELPWNLFSTLTAAPRPNMPDTIHFLQFHRGRGNRGRSISLNDALRNFDTSICKEPRDHIYGLLALLQYRDASMIKVDYGQAIEKVYLDAVEVVWTGYNSSKAEVRDRIITTLNLGRRMGVLTLDGGHEPWRNGGEIEDTWARELYDDALKGSIQQKRSNFIDWFRSRLENRLRLQDFDRCQS